MYCLFKHSICQRLRVLVAVRCVREELLSLGVHGVRTDSAQHHPRGRRRPHHGVRLLRRKTRLHGHRWSVTPHVTLAHVELNVLLFNACGVLAVFFAYLFFSGDLYRYLSASEISDYVDNYTPELNYYLVPVIVSVADSTIH